MSNQAFIQAVAPGAQEFQVTTGVFASVAIAQAILESSWGESVPVDLTTGQVSYNLFGIKGTGPAGSVLDWTTEQDAEGNVTRLKDYFRAYHNWDESIVDHGQLLMKPWFGPVRTAPSAQEACYALYNCGYATDVEYGHSLWDLIQYYHLTQYDFTGEEIRMIKELAAQVQALREQVDAQKDQTVSDWAEAAMKKAVNLKVLVGDSDGHLNPKAPVTREQFVTILDRLGLLK